MGSDWSETYYCADIKASQSNGAKGSFEMYYYLQNEAYYTYHLNLGDFDTTCDLGQGISFHIHSYWTNDTSSGALDYCGSSYTGDSYDPGLACSSNSQYADTLCVAINRTSDQGYTYSCSTGEYSDRKYDLCEKGDLSSKLGILYESSSDSKYFTTGTDYDIVDFDPPYEGNYDSDENLGNSWKSIVFHCNADGSRLVCADLVKSSEECKWAISDDDSTGVDLDNIDITLIIMGAAIVLISVLLFIVVYCHYCYLPVEVTHDLAEHPSEARNLI